MDAPASRKRVVVIRKSCLAEKLIVEVTTSAYTYRK
jgi:hypothetical protein